MKLINFGKYLKLINNFLLKMLRQNFKYLNRKNLFNNFFTFDINFNSYLINKKFCEKISFDDEANKLIKKEEEKSQMEIAEKKANRKIIF